MIQALKEKIKNSSEQTLVTELRVIQLDKLFPILDVYFNRNSKGINIEWQQWPMDGEVVEGPDFEPAVLLKLNEIIGYLKEVKP
jgi:hypothetical protein